MFLGPEKNQFNKLSFNKLFLIYAINNILNTVLYYFFRRMAAASIFIPMFQPLLGFHIPLVLFWQLMFHTTMAVHLLDLTLNLNRVTAIMMPLQYKTLWKGKIKWVTVFIVVVPYIAFCGFPFQEYTMVRDGTAPYYLKAIRPEAIPWPKSSDVLGPCITITCVSCLLCNMYVGLNLYKRKNSLVDVSYQQAKVYFVFTMCVFVNQFLTCVTQVI